MNHSTDHTELDGLSGSVRRSRRRQRIVAAGALVAGALLVGGCFALDEPTAPPTDGMAGQPTDTSLDGPGTSDALEPPSIEEAAEDGLGSTDDSHGLPDSGADVGPVPTGTGGEDPVNLDPAGDDAPDDDAAPDGCAAVLATGAKLLVSPSPAVLPSGTMKGSLAIKNCGNADVDWTAATKPSVTLAAAAGNVAPGSTSNLGFTIDSDAYEPGAIAFKIKVSEAGHSHYVDVQAYRPNFGQDLAGGFGLSGGADAGGCANQCITKAWLTPNLTSPNVGLEVKTNTPATIKVSISKHAPTADAKGNPVFIGVVPMGLSKAGTTQWKTTLTPLQPTTKYFIIVSATDSNGKTAYRSSSFVTITPLKNPGGFKSPGAEAGCTQQCITKAVLTAGAGFSSKHLEVKTHTPAQLSASVSTKAPTYEGSIPKFEKSDAFALSGLEYIESWNTDVAPLASDTTYHIIVRAIDASGHQAYRVGTFHTATDPGQTVVITVHQIHVSHDGDDSWKNRGELSFAWGVGDTTVGTRGEDKIGDGTTINVPESKDSFVVQNATGFLPTVYVSANERDADGKVEFCTMGVGVMHDWGHNDSCDAKWNVADSGLITVDGIASMTKCSEFGLNGNWADGHCMKLTTVSHGKDYPEFTAVVSFHIPQ